MLASLAICIYYRPVECLQLVLESILRDPMDHKQLEIFICDDCCPAPQEDIENIINKYKDHFGKVTHLRNHERRGFRKTHLLAKAIDQAEGEVFVFLDGDCVLVGQSLSQMIKAADQYALCQGYRTYLTSNSIDWAINNLSQIQDFVILREKFHCENNKNRKNRKARRESRRLQARGIPGRYNYASGYLMSIQTKWLRKLGMQLAQTRGQVEDTDLALRLFEKFDIDLLEVPDAGVLHLFEHH
jgi:GT2 family glycosyltransferase